MNELIRFFEKHSEAMACYRELKAQGCRPKIYLNHTKDGNWVVTTRAH